MKNFAFRLLVFSLFFTAAKNFAQCGNNTLLTLNSQQAVNDFPNNHHGCTQFSGILRILGTDITNLAPLSQLTKISGSLEIYNSSLTNLNGLDNIVSIGSGTFGDLIITDNALLTDINALQNLTFINRNLEIKNNDALQNLSGLNALTNIDSGGILIEGNDALQNINGLQNLASVGVSGNNNGIIIFNNPALQNLNGLSSLQILKGGFRIRSNASLTDVSGINITSVLTGASNSFIIEDNNALQNLNGMSVNELKGYVQIIGNTSLQSVNLNVTNPSQPYSLMIDNNPLLNNISGFGTITQLTDNGNVLRILNNGSLQNLNGLNNITHINGNVIIKDNDVLQNLNGLSSLSTTGNNSSFEIMNNPALLNVNGLSNLTKTGRLMIQNNTSLLNIDGFSSLTQLTYTSDTKLLSILNNPNLESIQGIGNINQTTIGNLVIVNNPKVSVCNLPNICTYLGTAKPRSFGGNMMGCNTVPEVLAACESLSVNELKSDKTKIYPNPVSDVLNLSEKANKIEITDISGRIMKTENKTEKVNVSALSPGIYFIKIFNENKTTTIEKFIKK